ncbi:MAG TPA: helix-turn-helix transcriptional regulator [Verrucomicrobiae bacterium]|nr:helix-turn-helix transcriptional regulator [Verrucomicrobiae bacterium]
MPTCATKKISRSFKQRVKRILVRKTKLSPKDTAICQRLYWARERLGQTQAEVARQIGLERSTLQNHEHCRTPIRFEVALRFCRQFIVSEEWLATGEYTACWSAARQHGIKPDNNREVIEKKVFFRQCVDLWYEPSTRDVPSGMLFGDAFDKHLSSEYRRLVSVFFHWPRVWLQDSDIPELASNFLTAINERFILLLSNEAKRRKLPDSAAWRVYTRYMVDLSDLVFRKMSGFKLRADEQSHLQRLRDDLFNQESQIPFLGESQVTEHRPASDVLVKN